MASPASWMAPTSITPSWRVEISGDAFDCTLMANGLRPAETSAVRGGRNRMVATPSLSGNSESVLGSATVQAAGSPVTRISYWSTMLLLLRTRTSAAAWDPGATVTVVGVTVTRTVPGSASNFLPSYPRKVPQFWQNSVTAALRCPHFAHSITATPLPFWRPHKLAPSFLPAKSGLETRLSQALWLFREN